MYVLKFLYVAYFSCTKEDRCIRTFSRCSKTRFLLIYDNEYIKTTQFEKKEGEPKMEVVIRQPLVGNNERRLQSCGPRGLLKLLYTYL